MTVPATELRCPAGKLLAKMRLEGATPTITEGNLLELHCRDCTKWERRNDDRVDKVLHRYNFVGALVETATEFFSGPPSVVSEDH